MSRRLMRALLGGLLVLTFGLVGTGAARAVGDDSKTVGGYTIYLGVLPAGVLFLYRPDHGDPEHRGPRFGDPHHVLVGLVETASGARIDDAEITARVTPVKGEPQERRLERMTVEGGAAYGNFFALRREQRYRVDLTIRRPGAAGAVETSFDYTHRL